MGETIAASKPVFNPLVSTAKSAIQKTIEANPCKNTSKIACQAPEWLNSMIPKDIYLAVQFL
jgi:hypothetical protein